MNKEQSFKRTRERKTIFYLAFFYLAGVMESFVSELLQEQEDDFAAYRLELDLVFYKIINP